MALCLCLYIAGKERTMIRKFRILGLFSVNVAVFAQICCIVANSLTSFAESERLQLLGVSVRHIAWVFTDASLINIAFLNLEILRLFSSLALDSSFLTELRLQRFRQMWIGMSLIICINIVRQVYFAFVGVDMGSVSDLADYSEVFFAVLVVVYDNLQLWYLSNLVVRLNGSSSSQEGRKIYRKVLALNQGAVCLDWFGILLSVVNLLRVYDWGDSLNYCSSAISSIHIGVLIVAVTNLRDLFKSKISKESSNKENGDINDSIPQSFPKRDPAIGLSTAPVREGVSLPPVKRISLLDSFGVVPSS
ncbi:hypothetical protein HDU91_004156 [Kappamyces sp. JEL0680]|nr:hypothetical protein HDU91_004156 [Kappamyces sp. JEL0680]